MTKKKLQKPKQKKSKEEISTARAFFYVATFFIVLVLTVFTLHYKHGVKLYICSNFGKFCEHNQNLLDIKSTTNACEDTNERTINTFNIRNIELLNKHADEHTFGIDISEYQGIVTWEQVYCVENTAKIDFVLVRATAGIDKVDEKFKENWKALKNNHFIRGAYHYYRPDEDPNEQAQNFISTVSLSKSDLPPILDVEKLPKKISRTEFISNLKIWMDLIENEYGIKPILYSGQKFHEDFLEQHFPDHVLWIANYNFFTESMQPHWHIWQFTEKGYVNGIKGNVDVNIFRGNIDDLKTLTIK